MQRSMNVTSLVLYVSVAAALAGAYIAGRYVGTSDAERIYAQVAHVQSASNSSNTLYFAGSVAELIQADKSAEALRVVEFYARLQAPAVSECLAEASCAFWRRYPRTGARR